MPSTRFPARSSFTVEIKRANRRVSDVQIVTRTRSGMTCLVDEVFGSTPGRPAPATISVERPLASSAKRGSEASANAVPSGQRVLPDLVSRQVDAGAERLQRLAEQRATQRRARAGGHTVVAEPRLVVPDKAARATTISAVDPACVLATAAQTTSQPAPLPAPDRDPRKGLRREAMRAVRMGKPLPSLPVGQRWKRRLPVACW
jgi:hypothetical protein